MIDVNDLRKGVTFDNWMMHSSKCWKYSHKQIRTRNTASIRIKSARNS